MSRIPYELNFRRDPSIYDGRFSNNGWLQELPKPLTKLTWDNPIMIGPAMAERLKLNFKDVAELEFNGKKVKGRSLDSGRPSRQLDHCISSVTGAPARAASVPAPALTFIRCAPVRLHGLRTVRSSPPLAISTNSPARRATRRWKRLTAASVRWCRSAVWRSTRKSRTSRKKASRPQELTLYKPRLRLFEGDLLVGHGDRPECLRRMQ